MTMSMPPGWYADPNRPGTEHWWDGYTYSQSRSTPPPALPFADLLHSKTVSPKSRTAATLLGFFLGGLGVDRFYLGNTRMGVAKLLLGWLTLGIWPLIDWIIILAGKAHDGEGLRVTDWDGVA
jgi:TM2 domain-containing membrane protein YozV